MRDPQRQQNAFKTTASEHASIYYRIWIIRMYFWFL